MTRIMLKDFVSKFIIYIYQNIKWIKEEFPPQIYKNIPQNFILFLAYPPPFPYSVLFTLGFKSPKRLYL